MSNDYILTSNGELYHYGIRGMKWGVRRYQNKDGSLTPAGKKRLYKDVSDTYRTKKYDQLMDKYADQVRPTINATKQIYTDYLYDKLDYSKGSLDYQMGSVTTAGAEKLLGKYADRRVSTISGHTMKAKYYLGTIMDSLATSEADRDYNREQKRRQQEEEQKRHQEYQNRIEIGQKYAKDARAEIERKTYKSIDEKRKAIDEAFRKKLREAEEFEKKQGHNWDTVSEEVWQQWGFALDELDRD